MADTKINVDLDPSRVLNSLAEMSEATKNAAAVTEEALGKKSVESIRKLEEAAEGGSTRITTFFRNMNQRVKEDLKTAFDATGILAGAKFAKDLSEGIKSVFDMEKAFDRLNTRLQLTGRTFTDFKKSVGMRAADAGQKIEDILPGVETAAARGGIRDPRMLSSIADTLSKTRATTGEDANTLSETVIELMKNQGQAMNSKNFANTVDALQATRVNGAFGTANEAGSAVSGLAYAGKNLNLSTRQLGGLAATASGAGPAGMSILHQLMEQGNTEVGRQKLSTLFGNDLFKNGKLDVNAIGKINTGKFGANSEQAISEAAGLTGASGADLTRFVEAFRNGMDHFKAVVKGTNETESQFATASDNLATGIDKFKRRAAEAAREFGGGISSMVNAIGKGDLSGAYKGLKDSGSALKENAGTITTAAAGTFMVSMLAGGGLNSLLRKIPGAGGVVAGAVGAAGTEAIAGAVGIQKVFVVNAAEFPGGGVAGGLAGALPGLATGGAALGVAATAATGAVAYGTGMALGAGASFIGEGTKLEDSLSDLFKGIFGDKKPEYTGAIPLPATMDVAPITAAVKEGLENATVKMNGPQTNPSAFGEKRGGGH